MDNQQPHSLFLNPRNWLAALLLLLAPLVCAVDGLGDDQELLDPDQAFAISTGVKDGTNVEVTWAIAPGYYLYRDRIRFSTDTPGITLGDAELPPGTIKNDEFFGKIATFRDSVTATIAVSRGADAPDTFKLKAMSQGCADIGVCYPPHTQIAQLTLAGTPNVKPLQGIASASVSPSLADRLGLGAPEDDFLDPDIAFQVDVIESAPNQLRVHWVIADEYYLYRDKLSIALEDAPGASISNIEIPPGETKHDEYFGDVQVFHHEITALVTLQRSDTDPADITLKVGYQGCAEAGICYPPIKKVLPVSLAGGDPAAPAANTGPATTPSASNTAVSMASQSQDDIVKVLSESSLAWVILFFFGAGILLAFTACMYPMIPIISSIIVGHGKQITPGKAFLLTLIYVEGVAVTYAVIGIISAELGAGVQAFFQNPWILGLFALIFVGLAMSMFGFFSMQLPASLQAKLSETSNHMKGGTIVGVAVMGVLSALIVGPCAGPVLIGALIYTSQSGDYLTGALAMFALGNGLGAPLLVICTSGGKLLPRAGGWMDTVKAVFGVILLGVAILMLERVLPGPVTLLLWALWLIIPAIYMGALDSLAPGVSGWRRLWKGLGIAILVYGIILIIGATTGARDPFNPLRNLNTGVISSGGSEQHSSQHLQFERIKTVADFKQAVADSGAQGRPVMLDFYADWCTYCIKMEDYTFSDAAVQAALAETTLLQADVTDNDEEDLALLNHFGIFAPPAILFFDDDGNELRESRLVGFMDAKGFLKHVENTFGK
jgi:thiol:disulfide interchange protein DsbD